MTRCARGGVTRLVVVGIVLCCATVTMAASASGAVSAPGAAVEPDGPEWTLYGHDFRNTRLNADETKVSRKSVARLTAKWSKDGLIGVSGTPVVAGGQAYFGDWTGTMWAVDAKTGKDIWSTKIGSGGFGFIVGAPAVEGNAVYV